MSQIPTISSVADAIAAVKAGYRAWFWLCPDIGKAHPPLLFTTFRDDPDMNLLRQQIDRLPIPEGAETCMGFVSITQEGRFQFGSSVLSFDMLRVLAEWTSLHAQEHSDLCRLKDAIFINVNSKGVVIETIEDHTLWASVSALRVPGTISETADKLCQLRPDRDAWFYMCSEPSGRCFLLIAFAEEDPEGSSFGKELAEVQLRFRDANRSARGILRRLPSGKLAFITADRATDTAFIIDRLTQTYPERLASLKDARVIHLQDGSFGGTVILGHSERAEDQKAPKRDLRRLQEVLQGLEGGASLYFWFGEGTPVLILETDKDALKTAVKAIGGKGVHGKARLSKKGGLEFQVKQSAPEFILSLAAFTKDNLQDWPVLRKLGGSRMTQRNSAGEVIDRQKDDRAWSFIN